MKNLSIGKAADMRKFKKKFRKTVDAVCNRSKEIIDDSARAVKKATKKACLQSAVRKEKVRCQCGYTAQSIARSRGSCNRQRDLYVLQEKVICSRGADKLRAS